MKLVSVIIPVYNAEKTIYNAIESILRQTYKNVEIIIVNDGSIDKTLEILKNIKNEKIKIYTQENKGPAAARNFGIKNSSGYYIAFLDSDDVWLEDKLERQVELIEKYNYDMLGAREFNFENKLIEIKIDKLLFKNYFWTSTVIIKKEIFDKIGYFNEEKKYCEDYEYWIKVCSSYKTGVLNEKLIIYSNNKRAFGVSGLSKNLKEMYLGEKKIYIKLYIEKKISLYKYVIIRLYSYIRYVRRVTITLVWKENE